MRRPDLHGTQDMTASSSSEAIVLSAQDKAAQLIRWESRGPDDIDSAMSRLARRYAGLTKGLLWSLRYRPPKRLWADAYAGLILAYEAERERQRRLLEHETHRTALIAGPYHPAVAAAETVLRSMGSVSPGSDRAPVGTASPSRHSVRRRPA